MSVPHTALAGNTICDHLTPAFLSFLIFMQGVKPYQVARTFATSNWGSVSVWPARGWPTLGGGAHDWRTWMCTGAKHTCRCMWTEYPHTIHYPLLSSTIMSRRWWRLWGLTMTRFLPLRVMWVWALAVPMPAFMWNHPPITSLFRTCDRRCEGVGDDGIVAIAAGCPHLLNLNLSYCTAITDASLQAIGHHSHQLLNLEVRGCEKLTSVGLVALAAGCSSLRELDIKRCRQVGDMGVLAVAKCCVDLRQVDTPTSPSCFTIFNILFLAECYQKCFCTYGSIMPSFRLFPKHSQVSIQSLYNIIMTSNELFMIFWVILPSKTKRLPFFNVLCWQVNLSYCPVTDRALYAVSTLRCMGNMKLVHCSHVSELGMSKALLACKGLKKVKLLGIQRSTFAPQVWEKLESRGCKLRWMDKRDPERPLPTTALWPIFVKKRKSICRKI